MQVPPFIIVSVLSNKHVNNFNPQKIYTHATEIRKIPQL